MHKVSIFDDIEDYISIFEQEESEALLDWFSLEGKDYLIELSRQFRTFFNYKYQVIRSKFTKGTRGKEKTNNDEIFQSKKRLFDLSSQLINCLNEIRVENGDIIEKIQKLMQKVRTISNNSDLLLLKKIKNLSNEIWENLHRVSELDIYHHPKLLKIALSIANIVGSVKGAYNLILLDFFIELRRNYLQLEEEIEISNPNSIESEKYNEKSEMRIKVRT